MSDSNEILTMEDMNKDIYRAMANSLQFPLNEIVAWGIFGDSTFVEDNALLYSNYADASLDTDIINSEHLELMNSIEQDVKHCIAENSHNVDFSTIDSAEKGIEHILDGFLLVKYEELTLLMTKKNSSFKGFPISWAALIIAYREMGIFAYQNGSYYVAMQLSEFCKECQARAMFKNIAFIKAYQKKLSEKHKKDGSKGGSMKGINYSEPKKKALDYHDKYLSDKNEKGKHVYSNDKASIEIIEHFTRKKEDLGYAPRSLSNIIRQHRDKQTKD